MPLCDQQPAGLYLRKGQSANISVAGLAKGLSLAVTLDFRPMWGAIDGEC
jgi:hypothetical protein